MTDASVSEQIPKELENDDELVIIGEEIKLEKDQNKKQNEDLKLDIKQEGNYLVLKVEDLSLDTSQEEDIIMSKDELAQYIEEKITEKLQQPEFNVIAPYEQRINELKNEIKTKYEEHSRLLTMFDKIYLHQIKLLRHKGIFKKVPKISVANQEDMPPLPEQPPINVKALAKEAAAPKAPSQHVSSTIPAKVPPAQATEHQPTKKAKTDDIECIDLTDEKAAALQRKGTTLTLVRHPAPLPLRPFTSNSANDHPPKPKLRLSAEDRGIVLQWDMPDTQYDKLASFDIFGYQESQNAVVNASLWKKIGSVEAMTLPMACTLMQFVEGHRYHFCIRAVDVKGLFGFYSDPISITYQKKK